MPSNHYIMVTDLEVLELKQWVIVIPQYGTQLERSKGMKPAAGSWKHLEVSSVDTAGSIHSLSPGLHLASLLLRHQWPPSRFLSIWADLGFLTAWWMAMFQAPEF